MRIHRTRAYGCVLALAALLCGCATQERSAPPPTAGAEAPPPPPPPTAGPSGGTTAKPPRVTARDFLQQGAHEEPGFGLYSYILFGSRPPDRQSDQYQRYLKAAEAYLVIDTVGEAEAYARRDDINVTYLPVRQTPATATAAVEAYDYARARHLLALAGALSSQGPVIVSTRMPLGDAAALPAERLYQDLSTVPPEVVKLWVRHFIAQAARERFWERQTRDEFLLGLRTFVARGGEQVNQLNSAVASLVWGFGGAR